MPKVWLFVAVFLFCSPLYAQKTIKTDILVVGGSTSGTMAGIQAARMGVNTIILEETSWLGGMLTSAGVSAIDGNHNMPSGLWGEFREKLISHYGNEKKLSTGWVSNTLFEPSIGQNILLKMCQKEPNLNLILNTKPTKIIETNNEWKIVLSDGRNIRAKILIDATELGDIAGKVGIKYDIGMESQNTYNEAIAPTAANNIIQDLTYTAILKDFGKDSDKTISKPQNYDPEEFRCACKEFCNDPSAKRQNPCASLMTYARLPNNKVLINWPIKGNDYYANMIEMTEAERNDVITSAKAATLRFIYFLQTELGFKNFGLADDEFPTDDLLPLIPYHRESRRIDGIVRMNLNHIIKPFEQKQPLYRTGIAVGDYAIDHHHEKNSLAPDLHFVPVPSFNIPLGSLIPKQKRNIIIAEKSISVSNLVNGASRLQPVVIQIGQAAGALAAYCIQKKLTPQEASVRDIQKILLDSKVYLMPYFDVKVTDPDWKVIQQVGTTGILKGVGESVNWSNRTWFYPDSSILAKEFLLGLKDFEPNYSFNSPINQKEILTHALFENIIIDFKEYLKKTNKTYEKYLVKHEVTVLRKNQKISRQEIARMLAPLINKRVDFEGKFVSD